ncbi:MULTISPECIES: class I SAM-dependent methyltransferase [Catenuloplanes]|uniref:Trans-aconitate methyltransferase n=1 Tax=Catenuloplanes niger TaxID=587534 RepID=A0AAE3ZMC7_9ACTN|nr:methyltransferase domain-containing protein [Catenuloplanes niger]MDR7321542.1 trans-aconitate methyltransferase [Catenuloplanes niger]
MTTEQPDYDTIAREWDEREYLREQVTAAIVERLPEIPDGALVLDLGCGTGEPGFTVKARYPAVRLLGVDVSEPMIALARSKARRLADVSFEARPMSDTGAGPASVDVLVSRFAFLYEDHRDVRPSLAEAARVLRPGGAFSVAVWDRAELNTLIALLHTAVGDLPGAAALPDPFAYDVLAAPGHRARLLREAGFASVAEAAFTFDYRIAGRAALLEVLHTSPYGPFVGALGPADQATVEDRVIAGAAGHAEPGGGYRIPITCRLLWGRR